jgi:hypothetical protein
MAISIVLSKNPYRNIEERTESKINLADEIFKFYNGYFEPSRIEVWRDAPTEALGGKLQNKIVCRDKSNVPEVLNQAWAGVRKDFGILESMILLIRGLWNVDGLKAAGYICVNNEVSSIETYGDIEVGAYPRGQIADVIDLFWVDSAKRQALVSNFISRFSKFEDESHSIRYIVFGTGAPLTQLVTEWSASYHRRPSQFLVKVLSTMREIVSDFYSYIRLMNATVLTIELYKIEDFRRSLRKMASKNEVEMDARSSLKLIGRKQDSYGKMIDELVTFLKPVLMTSLPQDRVITREMANAIAKQLGVSRLD